MFGKAIQSVAFVEQIIPDVYTAEISNSVRVYVDATGQTLHPIFFLTKNGMPLEEKQIIYWLSENLLRERDMKIECSSPEMIDVYVSGKSRRKLEEIFGYLSRFGFEGGVPDGYATHYIFGIPQLEPDLCYQIGPEDFQPETTQGE